jgi:hypothetical protein
MSDRYLNLNYAGILMRGFVAEAGTGVFEAGYLP